MFLLLKATVATISVLSSKPCEYAVWPVMFSSTCKRETSKQHAQVVKTILEACNKQSIRNNTFYRTVCIASDGEAKRGDALVIQMMVSELSLDSPIYSICVSEHVGRANRRPTYEISKNLDVG